MLGCPRRSGVRFGGTRPDVVRVRPHRRQHRAVHGHDLELRRDALTGPVEPRVGVVGPAARARLTALVETTRFSSLPLTIRCHGELPDVASNFVTVRRAGVTRTVLVHGDCSSRFSRLYDALARAVGIPS